VRAALLTPRRVAAALALVLAGDAFLLFGDTARPVSVAAAVAAYRHGEYATFAPLPASGVYVYDTTGYERVDRLSIRRTYPAVTTRTIRAAACGMRETVTIFREHVEQYGVCHDGTDIREWAFGTRLTYYRVTSAMWLECGHGGTRVAGGAPAGTVATYECAGDGTSATVTVTVLGDGLVPVGDLGEVPCRRLAVQTVLRGANAGGATRTLCTDPRTGLVLTEERSVGVTTRSAFVGRVTYTERAAFRLRSLVPET
jgi:hypothetical protein